MRPKRPRRTVVLGAPLAGLVALAGCARAEQGAAGGGPAAPAAAKPGPGTVITYLGNHTQAEAQVVVPQMQRFAERFPGARVEVTNVTAAYDEELQAMLAAGTPPDLFRTGGTGWAQYANQGAIAEIG